MRMADAVDTFKKIMPQPSVEEKKKKRNFSDRVVRNTWLNAYRRKRGFDGRWGS